ncbi:MAG: DUF2442 domain-containing protein [Bacteroidaceae bacterium]|nr:DUF2442 domain-containing protein [Bacteroidaceae bacterium]
MKLIWVAQAKPLDGYRMELTFNDGSRKDFDFSTLLGTHPMYEYIRDHAAFKDFRLDGWTVSWNNGQVDVAPEYLYEHGKTLNQ